MGGFFSKDDEEESKGLVLVPPLFMRDFRGRSRMTKSSYDWMFCKPGLKWLFNDYIRQNEAYGILRFRPSEDPRLTVHARLAAALDRSSSSAFGRMALRFQPDMDEPLTFLDIKAAASGSGGASARACYFDTQRGVGTFAILPLVAKQQGDLPDAAVGLRYSSPDASVGIIGHPLKQTVDQIWAVGRSGPFCMGVQFNPKARLPQDGHSNAADLLAEAQKCASYAISYSPSGASAGRANFTTALELKEQSQLTVSLLYHMAVQRLCKNPLEEDNIMGITNYIDIGLQVATSLVESGATADQEVALRESHLRLAAAWQVNKNWLVKTRVGSDAAACAVAVKAWWQPSMTFALAAVYDFTRRMPRFGFTYTLENYGNIRYERSSESKRMGRALVQRHVALPEDVANREGKGLLVHKRDLDNKALLGQTQAASAEFL